MPTSRFGVSRHRCDSRFSGETDAEFGETCSLWKRWLSAGTCSLFQADRDARSPFLMVSFCRTRSQALIKLGEVWQNFMPGMWIGMWT